MISNDLGQYFNHLSEIRRKTSHLDDEIDELVDGIYAVRVLEHVKEKNPKADSRMARFARNNEASVA